MGQVGSVREINPAFERAALDGASLPAVESIRSFVKRQRALAGISERWIPSWADDDLADLVNNYDRIGGRFLAYVDGRGEIVATGGIARCGTHQAEVRKLYVDHSASGRGLGRALLNQLELFALEAGYTSIRIKTFSHLGAAIRLYSQAGYVASETRIAGEPDVLVLEKTLRQPRGRRISPTVVSQTYQPQSHPLAAAEPSSASEIADIVRRVFFDGGFREELGRYTRVLGGVQSAPVWNCYFQSYDRVVAFSDGYLDAVEWTESALPFAGLIVDYGGGTGNFGAAIKLAGPLRRVDVLDISEHGLQIAREKMAVAGGLPHDSGLYCEDLCSPKRSRTGLVAGGVMNNVLYTIPSEIKTMVLQRVWTEMGKGGMLVLNDPLPVGQTRADLKDFLEMIATSAFKNGSPMTLFDIAMVAWVNESVLTSQSPPFQSLAELEASALDAGFEVMDRARIYYDRVTSLVLRKPL